MMLLTVLYVAGLVVMFAALGRYDYREDLSEAMLGWFSIAIFLWPIWLLPALAFAAGHEVSRRWGAS